MCRRIRPGRSAAAELTDPAHQALQQLPCRAATADGAGERIHHVGIVAVVGRHPRARQRPSCDSRRGSCAPAPSDCCALRCADSRFRGLDHTEAGGGSAIVVRARRHRQRRRRRIGPRREVEVDQRPHGKRAAAPRSPPAPADLRRRDTAWPVPGAEAACAPHPARVHRPRAATPALSPTRAARPGLAAASTKTVMPSVHAGSPRSAGATATVRPASADASRPSRCGPSLVDARRACLHRTSLVDQISVPP